LNYVFNQFSACSTSRLDCDKTSVCLYIEVSCEQAMYMYDITKCHDKHTYTRTWVGWFPNYQHVIIFMYNMQV